MFNNGQPQPTETEQPVYQQPQADQTAYQQPVYQQPQADQTAYQQPVYQQPVYQQNAYQQPAYQQPQSELEPPVSVGEWFIAMLLMCIPCVNIILMFVWAFGSGTNKSKSNYFKAALIWALISVVITVIISIAFSATIAQLISYYG